VFRPCAVVVKEYLMERSDASDLEVDTGIILKLKLKLQILKE
jgi:hypothetical protein